MRSRTWGLLTLLFVLLLFACAWWIISKGHDAALDYVRLQYVAVMIVLLGLCVAAGIIVRGRIDGILIDERNRISLARWQWSMWFLLIIGGYFVEALWNAANGLPVPVIQNQLLVLLGISSGSAVTSSMIAETKKTSTRPAPPGAPGKPTGAAPSSIGVLDRNVSPDDASWAELYLGDEIADRATVDISRLQQLVISVLLAVIFITLQWAALVKSDAKLGLQMPSFDDNSSFLWLLGLSHAAYIAYKAPTKTA